MYILGQLRNIDEDIGYLKGVGIKNVYTDTARAKNPEELIAFKDELEKRGLLLQSLCADWSWVDAVATGKHLDKGRLDGMCHILEAMGEAEIRTLLMPCSRRRLSGLSSDDAEAFWQRVVQAYREISEIAEGAGVNIASHTSMSPNSMIHDIESLDQFLKAVHSPANGLLLCIGCVWLACDSVEDFMERYRERTYAVHVRNVRSTGDGAEETRLDDGQIDLPSALRKLKELGYDSCLIPEHLPKIEGSEKLAITCAYGYIKGICDSI